MAEMRPALSALCTPLHAEHISMSEESRPTCDAAGLFHERG